MRRRMPDLPATVRSRSIFTDLSRIVSLIGCLIT